MYNCAHEKRKFLFHAACAQLMSKIVIIIQLISLLTKLEDACERHGGRNELQGRGGLSPPRVTGHTGMSIYRTRCQALERLNYGRPAWRKWLCLHRPPVPDDPWRSTGGSAPKYQIHSASCPPTWLSPFCRRLWRRYGVYALKYSVIILQGEPWPTPLIMRKYLVYLLQSLS